MDGGSIARVKRPFENVRRRQIELVRIKTDANGETQPNPRTSSDERECARARSPYRTLSLYPTIHHDRPHPAMTMARIRKSTVSLATIGRTPLLLGSPLADGRTDTHSRAREMLHTWRLARLPFLSFFIPSSPFLYGS